MSKDKNSIKDYFSLGEVGRYFFRSKEEKKNRNINLRIMHGINKIAMVMFLLGVIYLIVKRLF